MKMQYVGPLWPGPLEPNIIYEVKICHFDTGEVELVGIEGKFSIRNFKLISDE